jgi:hypothetical protein
VSSDRDVTRIVRSWLEEGVTALPDRVLDHVLDQVPATRQRRSWWPARRVYDMSLPIRLAIGAAAVLVAMVVGLQFLPYGSSVGGGPAATPTPSPSPTPISLPLNPQSLTVAVPGTYLAGDPFQVPLTMSIPAGWVGKLGGPYAVYLDRVPVGSGGASISISLSQTIYADPCNDRGFLAPQPGPTVDDLTAALASLPGFDATAPTDVIVGGHAGRQITLTAPASFVDCTPPDSYRLWQLPLGGVYEFTNDQRTTLRIVDVNGQRLVVSSDTWPSTTAPELEEIQSILDSIRFD